MNRMDADLAEQTAMMTEKIMSHTDVAPADGPVEALSNMKEISELATRFAFGEVWTRPALEMKTRCAITVAITAALGRVEPMKIHLHAALNSGWTAEELWELLFHTGVYAGMPAFNEAGRAAREVFRERGILM